MKLNLSFKYIAAFLFSSFAIPLSSNAAPICDFNRDGMSEIAFVKMNKSGNYDWKSFDPRTGRTQSILNNFGNSSSILIPGNWFEPGRAAAAIVNKPSGAVKPNGLLTEAVWMAKSRDYAGGSTRVRNLGRLGDIVILGGDFDGNGIADSLLLKQTTKQLGLRINYFLSSYNGDNLGRERAYRTLGSPFKDPNFFFSPDGSIDYLAVLQRGSNGTNSVLKLRPFTNSPQSFSIGALPGGSVGPLPLKQGPRKADLLVFYARRGENTLLTVKTVNGKKVLSKIFPGNGAVTVGDYFEDRGWEIAVQDGDSFTFINPKEHTEYSVTGAPSSRVVSCISNQLIQ